MAIRGVLMLRVKTHLFDEGVLPKGKAVQLVLKILFYEPQSCLVNWRRLKNRILTPLKVH